MYESIKPKHCKTSSLSSSSSLSSVVSMSADLASFLKCPLCLEYVLPPIFQCFSGHLICVLCRRKLTCCPTCRGHLGNIRNLALEKVVSQVKFPCKHSGYCCAATLAYTEMAVHEENCEFRTYLCPYPGELCQWQGPFDLVMKHLLLHECMSTMQGDDVVFLAIQINLAGAACWVMMQSCFGHNFMLLLGKKVNCAGHQQYFAIVQLIGSRREAENFVYRLQLNCNGRRLTWKAVPRSIHDGIASAIQNSDCLVFDASIALLFVEDGNLPIYVTISLV